MVPLQCFISILYTCSQCQGSTLFTGQWSTNGCNTTFNFTTTICRCNRLRHFAILLIARPLVNDEVLSQTQVLALQITGYIGVSLSLVAMAATTFVFVFLKWVTPIILSNHSFIFLTQQLIIIILISMATEHFVRCVTIFTSSCVWLWALLRSYLWQE